MKKDTNWQWPLTPQTRPNMYSAQMHLAGVWEKALRTDGWTDKPSYRDATAHLKINEVAWHWSAIVIRWAQQSVAEFFLVDLSPVNCLHDTGAITRKCWYNGPMNFVTVDDKTYPCVPWSSILGLTNEQLGNERESLFLGVGPFVQTRAVRQWLSLNQPLRISRRELASPMDWRNVQYSEIVVSWNKIRSR